MNQNGCRVTAPGPADNFGYGAATAGMDVSAGRFPDGADSGSNCADFYTQVATMLAAASTAGTTNIKVISVQGFKVGQSIAIDAGSSHEAAVIAAVGTAGGTTTSKAIDAGGSEVAVKSSMGFADGQTLTIDEGTNAETVVIASIKRGFTSTITSATPLKFAHLAGAQVSGSGITLVAPLSSAHAGGSKVTDYVPTPGAANRYTAKP
jgi:hypothetical protein